MKLENPLIFIAALLAGLSVVIGAISSHGLGGVIDAQALNWMSTGVRYQQYHSIALLVTAFAYRQWPAKVLLVSANSFIMGILLFSGGLYLKALTQQAWLGMMSPLGGLFFLAGWAFLARFAWVSSSK